MIRDDGGSTRGDDLMSTASDNPFGAPAGPDMVQIHPAPGNKSKTLRPASGATYWRSLDQVADTKEFQGWLQREFPSAAEFLDGKSRRTMLKLMAASFGLAGLAACSRPEQHLAPQARGEMDYVPGKAYDYTSAFVLSGHPTGLVVRTYDGRPTKIEGNPDHPESMGAAMALAQASVLDVYDPDRSKTFLVDGAEANWEVAGPGLAGLDLGDGTGVRFLSETIASPTVKAQRDALLRRLPNAKWIEFEGASLENEYAGSELAFGRRLATHPQLDKAKVIASLDYDFLGNDFPTPRLTKLFSRGRRASTTEELESLSRLYVVESQFSLTGANAEHRLRQKGSEIAQFAKDLLAAVQGGNVAGNDQRGQYLQALAADLRAAGAEALVVAGPRQPAVVHALAHQINTALGSEAMAFTPVDRSAQVSSGIEALAELTAEMSGGQVSTLFVFGGNPAYTAPANLDFSSAMGQVGRRIHLGTYQDETGMLANWHIPAAHYLEAWGDAETSAGVAAVQQPMISPLYGGKSLVQVLAALEGEAEANGMDQVKAHWASQLGGSEMEIENAWRRMLNDGVVPNTGLATVQPALNAAAVTAAAGQVGAGGSGLEVAFVTSAAAYDGSFTNNAWMQENPDPVTKLTWDNAVMISPSMARSQSLADGDLVRLEGNGMMLEAAVMIQPGQAEDSVTIATGYGRPAVGKVGTGVGFNANALRSSDGYWYGSGFTLTPTGGSMELATTQEHGSIVEPDLPMGGGGKMRPVYREATVDEYREEPNVIREMVEVPEMESIHPDPPVNYSEGYQWGMSIDLATCTGCSACVVACQAENNIPVVGKAQVLVGREMHWLRVDRYYVGLEDEPRAVEQPIPCMQCENAPCEYVCPVAATTHSPEGLNDMVYNRCVGTRYCLNNCPFKVRHFNFLNYHKGDSELLEMVRNPEVTVRMRGIMEKCTYCVQRIQNARIAAQNDGRRQIREGEILTACQQTCPADAIVFGNINDPDSQVTRLKAQDRNYAMLEELNIRPRTTYLAKIRNVNPALESPEANAPTAAESVSEASEDTN